MNCPRCNHLSLVEHDRSGITIDRCERCRGIWLDRGELEKLLANARAGERRRDDDDDDDDRPRTDDRRGPFGRRDDDDSGDRHPVARRRSWWDILD